MKSLVMLVIKGLVLGLIVYLGCVHLEHSAGLSGYLSGCKDTIAHAADQDNEEIPADVVDGFCKSLSEQYVNKK